MGYVHAYYGEGKGKTTAAMGLALRALGNDMKVVFVQFLKSEPSGEIRMLERMPGISVYWGKAGDGFTNTMTPSEAEETQAIHLRNFEQGRIAAREAQMLILDEILCAIELGFFPLDRLVDFLRNRPETLEVILTGRPLPEALRDMADYITGMRNVRHPYDHGLQARKGVEY